MNVMKLLDRYVYRYIHGALIRKGIEGSEVFFRHFIE
jgi:hypothetical protein